MKPILTLFFLTMTPIAMMAQSRPYDVNEAYQVYNVLLPHEESYGFAKGTLVIQQETEREGLPRACLTTEAAKKFRDAITDFDDANSKQWLLQRRFAISKPYDLVPMSGLRQRLQVEKKGERYPGSGGVITLSAVGFNRKKTLAIVHSKSMCGGLCGSFRFHLLEKVDGKWKEVPGVTCAGAS